MEDLGVKQIEIDRMDYEGLKKIIEEYDVLISKETDRKKRGTIRVKKFLINELVLKYERS